MAKKCPSCNRVYDDSVIYCQDCGRKLETQTGMDRDNGNTGMSRNNGAGNFDVSKFNLKGINFAEWSLLIAAILGLIIAWEVSYVLGGGIGVGVLLAPRYDKQNIQFKAPLVTKIIAIATIALCVVCMFL